MINLIETIFRVLLLGNGIYEVPIEDESLRNHYNLSYVEILKHQRSYTQLLKNYVDSSIFNITIKIIFKIVFFIFALYIWYLMLTTFKESSAFALDFIQNFEDSDFTQICVSLAGVVLPALITLITSFLVIPEIIAKYLFNSEEENSLIEIIKSLQTYDHNIYKEKIKPELLAHDEIDSTTEGENESNTNQINGNSNNTGGNEDRGA